MSFHSCTPVSGLRSWCRTGLSFLSCHGRNEWTIQVQLFYGRRFGRPGMKGKARDSCSMDAVLYYHICLYFHKYHVLPIIAVLPIYQFSYYILLQKLLYVIDEWCTSTNTNTSQQRFCGMCMFHECNCWKSGWQYLVPAVGVSV